jgi:dihydrodipicolinate synthase/N-acetylneuraminate lyase
MSTEPIDPIRLLKPGRKITGFSAILLPFTPDGAVDWDAFTAHVARTAEAGLTPAVNMDTGYVHLLDDATRLEVLRRTRETLGTRGNQCGDAFVAGAFVGDSPGATFDLDGYRRRIEPIREHGGTPVIFQSYGLTQQPDAAIVASYSQIGEHCERFIGFELNPVFAPFGAVYSLDAYRGLMGVPQCIGAKHSSLSRELEWRRLMLRDAERPDFLVLTGNDLAIDMVMYGSDYLLGLSTFAPDVFARRDAAWAAGDPAFYELNDVLQYLGFLTFRDPVPAYKHSAAMFLNLRGWTRSDRTHPQSLTRPASDREILRGIGRQLGVKLAE